MLKPASAEDSEPGNSPAYANDVDGSNFHFWSAAQYPKWWKVDLQGFYDLTSVVIRNYVDGSRFYHYNIEVSTDDITYTQVAEKLNDNIATDAGDTYTISATARYIRVNMTYNSSGSGIHITDLRAYGTTSVNTNTISASAGSGGIITPAGIVTVLKTTNASFAITPNSGFAISDVTVDGSSVGAVPSYTFTNVTADHVISASFVATSAIITVTQGTGGTISPQGQVVVALGNDQTFNITAKSGFQISDVIVDGNPLGAVSSYTFPAVATDHTISADLFCYFSFGFK